VPDIFTQLGLFIIRVQLEIISGKSEWEPKVRFVRAEANKMRIEVATNVQNQIKSHLFVSVFVSVACIVRLHIAIQLLRIFCRS